MKKYLLFLVLLTPALAHAESVVLSPAPALWVNPANPWSYGVSIGRGYSGISDYPIDLNGDGSVDYTLAYSAQNHGLIIKPFGSNAVMAYLVGDSGGSYVANLSAGTVVAPSSSLSPVWQPTVLTPPFTLNGIPYPATYVYPQISVGDLVPPSGLFLGEAGFIGLQFQANENTFYGFLQLDCRGYSGSGCFYEGYGYNTLAGQPITTQSVPEPSGLALLGLGLAIGCLSRLKQREREPEK